MYRTKKVTTAIGMTLATAAAMVGMAGMASAAEARPASDPPGNCSPEEDGQAKLGPDGYYYVCVMVDGGWYWLPE